MNWYALWVVGPQKDSAVEKEKSRKNSALPASSTIRFGPYELDLRSAELRKNDLRIRLQEQPFLILVALLERPGELVLREEIRNKLWPDDTVVEFDHGINAAVKRLRDALRDSVEKPRYIETLARRGYRFIAAVSHEPESAGSSGVAPFAPAASLTLPPKTPRQPKQSTSIAVLAFTNMSSDTENEYFSDGLAEELINKLAHGSGLKVIARTSAFAFKGRHEDIRNIARALGVENLVEGSVRRVGSRIRITAQLIAASDGTHLWSERYDRELTDIFAIQDEIAQSIATSLRVCLTGASRQYTPRLPAYDMYLKARHYLAAFSHESLPRSRDFYEQTIAMDGAFALAHSGLAMALVSLVLPGITPAQIAMPLAREAAKKALELDPALHEAHAMLGMVAALYDFDWKEAEERFLLALAREPIPAYIRWYYSFSYLLPTGRIRESIQQCMYGMQDDPLNFIGRFHYAGALLAGGNQEAGEAHLQHLSELHPTLYQSFYLLALSQAMRGASRQALNAAEIAYSLAPWSPTTKGLFAGLLKSSGDPTRAGELLDQILPVEPYGSAMGLSLFHVGCAEMEQAAKWAEKAVAQRDTRMILLIGLVRASQPNLLRSHSRWSAIARTLGIPTTVCDN
jgi:TolB-like protein